MAYHIHIACHLRDCPLSSPSTTRGRCENENGKPPCRGCIQAGVAKDCCFIKGNSEVDRGPSNRPTKKAKLAAAVAQAQTQSQSHTQQTGAPDIRPQHSHSAASAPVRTSTTICSSANASGPSPPLTSHSNSSSGISNAYKETGSSAGSLSSNSLKSNQRSQTPPANLTINTSVLLPMSGVNLDHLQRHSEVKPTVEGSSNMTIPGGNTSFVPSSYSSLPLSANTKHDLPPYVEVDAICQTFFS